MRLHLMLIAEIRRGSGVSTLDEFYSFRQVLFPTCF
jgi:hypothetical protein